MKTAEEVTEERRELTKSLAYGLIYGKGVSSFASELHCGIECAREYIATFKRTFAAVEDWKGKLIKSCRESSQQVPRVSSLGGRVRYFAVRHQSIQRTCDILFH